MYAGRGNFWSLHCGDAEEFQRQKLRASASMREKSHLIWGPLGAPPHSPFFGDLRGTGPAYSDPMQATFLQKVILTLVAAFFASCLVWFYKNIIQKGDEDINKNWRIPAATAHP